MSHNFKLPFLPLLFLYLLFHLCNLSRLDKVCWQARLGGWELLSLYLEHKGLMCTGECPCCSLPSSRAMWLTQKTTPLANMWFAVHEPACAEQMWLVLSLQWSVRNRTRNAMGSPASHHCVLWMARREVVGVDNVSFFSFNHPIKSGFHSPIHHLTNSVSLFTKLPLLQLAVSLSCIVHPQGCVWDTAC